MTVRRYNLSAIALAAAWLIYLLFAGPYLISEPSDIAVCLGVALGIALVALTYHRLTQPITTKEKPE